MGEKRAPDLNMTPPGPPPGIRGSVDNLWVRVPHPTIEIAEQFQKLRRLPISAASSLRGTKRDELRAGG